MADPRYARQRARQRRNYKIRRLLWLFTMLLLAAAALWLLVHALRGDPPAPTSGESAASSKIVSSASSTAAAIQSQAPDLPPPATVPPETEAPTTEAPTEPPAPDDSWKLLLVNAQHPLPEGYSVRLKELRNGHQVDERIYPELQQMFDDARAVGIYPLINESFRTAQRQQEILDSYTARYEAEGLSLEEAAAKARTVVALPGTSEHELGLALDLIAEFDADSTATWQWLRENCWRYGFILRYPADKEEITGISYEPWHFRYVGVPAAQEIMERGLCLEEYLAG